MIPQTLDGWTLDVIRNLIAMGVPESDVFDFKSDLQPAEHQRKSVAAFANTNGGFLIFGVTDNGEIVGVRNKELPRDFSSKLSSGIEPAVEYRFSALRIDSSRMVFLCHVFRSAKGPHAVDVNGTPVFFKRTPAGTNARMSRAEILEWHPRVEMADNVRGGSPGEIPFLANEIQRVRERAYYINCHIWQMQAVDWYIELSRQGIAADFESLLPGVFHRITSSSSLINGINYVRDRLRVVNAASNAVSQKFNSGTCRRGDLEEYCRVLRENVPDLVMNADRALSSISQLSA